MRLSFSATTALALMSLFIASSPLKAMKSPRQTGYFISIDGLRPDRLAILSDGGILNAPHGLGWLYRNGVVAEKAHPIVTTLTAASHISNITCSTPSRHGIIANDFLKDGKYVSGFAADFDAEPLWQAARRQGRKVLSLAYVGSDGRDERRRADYGIAYPDRALLGGKHQTLAWSWNELGRARGWKGLPRHKHFRQGHLSLTLNPRTSETKTVHVLVEKADKGTHFRMIFDLDKDLTNGSLAVLDPTSSRQADLFIQERATAGKVGRKRRTFVWYMSSERNSFRFYVSKASYNNAYPESFRQALDHANLVWPDYGLNTHKVELDQKLEAQAMIDRFLVDAGLLAKSMDDFDVILFYQPLLDTMGHSYEGTWPKPFNPAARDKVTEAYVKAFRIVDRNLSRLMDDFRQRDVVALMGDHGMDEMKKTINVAALLPANHLDKVNVVATGTMLLLYPKTPAEKAEADRIGEALARQLSDLRYEHKRVLGRAFQKTKADQLRHVSPHYDMSHWQYGDALWAFTSADGYWLQYRPLDKNLFGRPEIPGMHGQFYEDADMATAFLLKAPGLQAQRLPQVRLIDALPTFMNLLNMRPPRDCMGRVLDLGFQG